MSENSVGQVRHPNEVIWYTGQTPPSGWLAIIPNHTLQEMEKELSDLRKEVAKLRFLATPEARMTNAITKAFERDVHEAFEKETYILDSRLKRKYQDGTYVAHHSKLKFDGWNACWEYFKELK